MQNSEFTAVVKQVIELAAHNQGWSLLEMAKRVDRSVSTLHRWRLGGTLSFDMPILLRIFRWAGVSMDDAFQLRFEDSQAEASALEVSENKVAMLTRQIESMHGMIAAMSALLGSLEIAAQPSVPDVITNIPSAHAIGD